MIAVLDSGALANQDQRYAYAVLHRDGETVSENRLFYTTYGKIKVLEPNLTIHKTQIASDRVRIDIACENFARMLLIEGPEGLVISDNAFDMGAGENKSVWIEGACDASQLNIRTMNEYMA